LTKLLKEEGMSAVVPFGIPDRAELWRRLQLARAVLNHRSPDAATVTIVLCALDGVPMETLMRRRPPARQPLGFVVDWHQIARDLRSACDAQDISRIRLARALGVSPKTVRRLLQGSPATPDVLVSVVSWLYPDEPRPRWIVSASAEEAV
jgi:hypothetical protein